MRYRKAMNKTISELEALRKQIGSPAVYGTRVFVARQHDRTHQAIKTSIDLGRPVIAVTSGEDTIAFYAIKT